MIGSFFAKLHAAFYGFGRAIADACDQNEAQPANPCDFVVTVVTVKPHTRKRPLADKKAETHARLRQELGRLA